MDKHGEEHYTVREYRRLDWGEYIVIFADPAEGGDYCAADCLSKKYLDYPLVYSEKIDSAQFGNEIYGLAQYIYTQTGIWPMVAVERNTGQATIHVLRTLNYPNLFHMVDFSAPNANPIGHGQGSIGWLTTGHRSAGEIKGTRRKMLDDLALAIRQKRVTFYDEEQIRQLLNFRYREEVIQKKKNKRKDDHVMASAGAWEVHLVSPDVNPEEEPDEESMRADKQKWRFR